MEYWADPAQTAIAIPAGQAPAHLNGIPCDSWQDHPADLNGWEALAAGMPIAEPPFNPPKGFKLSAGVVILEPDGRIWLTSPSNGFGGYQNTFPKGTLDGMSAKAAALSEVFEETGLQVRLIGHLIDVTKSTSHVRYYLGVRSGGTPIDMGWESQAVLLAPRTTLRALLNNAYDLPIIQKLDEYFSSSRLLKQPGGVLVRVITAIDGFKQKHGKWPAELWISQESLNTLFEYHLTDEGRTRLENFIMIKPTNEMDITAKSGQLDFDYGNEMTSNESISASVSSILGFHD